MSTRFEPTSPNKWSTNPLPCNSESEIRDQIKTAAEEYVEVQKARIQDTEKLKTHIQEQSRLYNSTIFKFNESEVIRREPAARNVIETCHDEVKFWRELLNDTHNSYEGTIRELRDEIYGLRILLAKRGVTADISSDDNLTKTLTFDFSRF